MTHERLHLAAYAGDRAALIAACGQCPIGDLVGRQCGLRPGPVLATCPSRMTLNVWLQGLSLDGLLVAAMVLAHEDRDRRSRITDRTAALKHLAMWIGHPEQHIHVPRPHVLKAMIDRFDRCVGDATGEIWRRDMFSLLRVVVRAFALRGFIPTTLCSGKHNGSGAAGCPQAAHHHHDGQGDCLFESDEAWARVIYGS